MLSKVPRPEALPRAKLRGSHDSEGLSGLRFLLPGPPDLEELPPEGQPDHQVLLPLPEQAARPGRGRPLPALDVHWLSKGLRDVSQDHPVPYDAGGASAARGPQGQGQSGCCL